MGYPDPDTLRTRVARSIPWRIHRLLPQVIWRQRVAPFIERGRRGWSRWDVMALGADQSLLPALGEALVHLGEHTIGTPMAPPFDGEGGHAAWRAELIRHGRALSRLREDPQCARAAAQIEADARAALAFVAAWHRSLWD